MLAVTARHIESWVDLKPRDAQESLPILIRRLIHRTSVPASIIMAGGHSISRPGWDGIVHTTQGSAWVPVGASYWELGCDAKIADKATYEYKNRLKQTDASIRTQSAFIFVSPRRWPGRDRWVQSRRAAGDWQEIRAYDADNLEEWLEQAPEVALWFGELIGLQGPGVQSLDQFWLSWSDQSRLSVSKEAIFAGREEVRDRLFTCLTDSNELITIRADGVEEAAAFAAAAVMSMVNGSDQAVVITDPNGWRFVATNPSITLTITSRTEYALELVKRPGLRTIIPVALGVRGAQHRGASARADDKNDLILDRPRSDIFEQALQQLGHDPADAMRLARATGRSWTVYRRLTARNPSIASPRWITLLTARALTTICLVGSWSADEEGDQAVIARIAGRSYEEVEHDLIELAQLDDSPVIRIGSVWKAKSPLELLHLYGSRLTRQELDRYFDLMQEVLTTPDPILDLPEEERYAASIYGKKRAQTGLLIDALVDSLTKLTVVSERMEDIAPLNLPIRAERFIRNLLDEADEIRWLSLSGVLRELAEAAPMAFLAAVERSLQRTAPSVLRLLSETASSGLGGRCWHADLLWALETIAWNPRYLTRVALILTRLATVEIKGNWGNTPLNSLVSLFRSWLPQTVAPIERRISTLDEVIKRDADVGWKVLCALALRHHDSASPNARPRWRDDDSGVGHGAPVVEVQRMIIEAGKRLIVLAQGHPTRLCELIKNLECFGKDEQQLIWTAVQTFIGPRVPDASKDLLCSALRAYLFHQLNFSDSESDDAAVNIVEARRLLDLLQPIDPVTRFQWLFEKIWVELPEARESDHQARFHQIEKMRCSALEEILGDNWPGSLDQLVQECGAPETVGRGLASLDLPEASIVSWMVHNAANFTFEQPAGRAIAQLLAVVSTDKRKILVQGTLAQLPQDESLSRSASLFVLCPCDLVTWKLVSSAGESLEQLYWHQARPGWRSSNPDELMELVSRLLEAKRPRTAFQAICFEIDKVDAGQLFRIIEGICGGEESEGPIPDAWDIGKAFDRIESADIVLGRTLALLEYGLYPLVEHSERGAKALMQEIASNPAMFVELVCLAFKPKSANTEALDDVRRAAAMRAFDVLHDFTQIPGTQSDGTIGENVLEAWIIEVRKLCEAADCDVGVADDRIGHMLAYSPNGSDDIWPCEAVREVLERLSTETMMIGFVCGTRNRRGFTTRGAFDGGDQERNLATKFRKNAEALASSHPNVSMALDGLERSYARDALEEDLEAKLRMERG